MKHTEHKRTLQSDDAYKHFKRIHIRTEADMDRLWSTYGMACYHLGDRGIILVDHRVPDSHTA